MYTVRIHLRNATRSLEPHHFAGFRCLAADCEDTCCAGWAIAVDKPAYEKFQQCADPEWRSKFTQLIAINTTGATGYDYARIQLSTTTCPFLCEGLCSIHKKFGEEYLPVTCASFPRVWNVVDGVLEKSLDLGCPEAARQALLNPQPMAYSESAFNEKDFNTARISAIDTSTTSRSGKPYGHFTAVRALVVWLLQNRKYPLWKRVVILGLLCDKLQETAAGGGEPPVPELLQSYRAAISEGLFEDLLNGLRPYPAVQLETVMELIIARIGSDFTNRRFLACYQEFMDGIPWSSHATMDEIGARYQAVREQHYAPFMSRHEHILEHYLVNYVYRSLFPFGPQESTYKLRDQNTERSIHSEYLLLAAYFSIIQTLLGGIAGLYKEAFGPQQIIQVIYTFTRTFEHSQTFPQRVIQSLEAKGLATPAGIAALIRY